VHAAALMTSMKNDNLQKSVRPVGRPARVDAPAIFDAALAIGLDQVTMKAVADRLGVGISTLYQYVKNRSELVRLAALRQIMARCPPHGADQHWAEVALRYAEDLLKTLLDEPQLIVELMKGGLGPQIEAEILERFLGEMQAHGFTPEDGIRFYRSISMVTIGAYPGGARGERAAVDPAGQCRVQARGYSDLVHRAARVIGRCRGFEKGSIAGDAGDIAAHRAGTTIAVCTCVSSCTRKYHSLQVQLRSVLRAPGGRKQ
jgi:AcrR family transcriptional regulator